MPNYEYYRSLYTGQRQAQMENAIQTAHDELMARYKEEVRVQELLWESLQDWRQLNQKAQQDWNEMVMRGAMKSGSGSKGAGDLGWKDLMQIMNQAVDNRHVVLKMKTDVRTQGYDKADNAFDIPENNIYMLTRALNDPQAAKQGTSMSWFKGQLFDITRGMSNEQKMQMFAKYQGTIADSLGVKADNNFKKQLSVAMGLENDVNGNILIPDTNVINAYKLGIANQEIQRNPVNEQYAQEFYGLAKTLLTQGVKPTPQQSNAQIKGKTVKEKAEEITAAIPKVDTTLPPELRGITLETIATPTREDVLSRAAELYTPYASKGFQEQMAPAAEPQAMREAFMTELEAEQEQAIKSQIPEYMRPLVALEGKVAPLVDKSMEELKTGGVGFQYGVQQVESGKNNRQIMEIIQSNADLSPEEQEQAMLVLAAKQYNQYRNKKKSQEPLK